MARSNWSGRSARVVRREFAYPQGALNVIVILILATAGVLMGVFGTFLQIQSTMQLGVPWLFPYAVVVGALTVLFLVILAIMSNNNSLTPGIAMVFCFVLFVLYLTGIVETGVQLFGAGGVSGNCNRYVSNSKVTGPTTETLAWLQQNSICQQWYTAFAFWLVGVLLFFFMFFFSLQIGSGQMD